MPCKGPDLDPMGVVQGNKEQILELRKVIDNLTRWLCLTHNELNGSFCVPGPSLAVLALLRARRRELDGELEGLG